MMYLSLQPYRVSMNSSILIETAKDALKKAASEEGLKTLLGYDEEASADVKEGLQPQRGTNHFVEMIKQNKKRSDLKAKRLKRGYPDFRLKRSGITGFIQKTFFDLKELQMPIEYEIISWLDTSPRYNLLVSIHDAILQTVSSGEPKQVEFSEINSYPNPVAQTIWQSDVERAARIAKALNSPIQRVSPETLIEDFVGYVVYHRRRGIAYYFADNES